MAGPSRLLRGRQWPLPLVVAASLVGLGPGRGASRPPTEAVGKVDRWGLELTTAMSNAALSPSLEKSVLLTKWMASVQLRAGLDGVTI